MNRNKILIVLIFIGYLVIAQNALVIKDISNGSIFSENRHYTLNGVCEFIKVIQCTIENIGENCGTSLSIAPSLDNTRIAYNETSAIYQLVINVEPNSYTYVINSVYALSLECIELDSTIQFNLVGSYYRVQNPSANTPTLFATFRMDGFNTEIPYSLDSFKSVIVGPAFTNCNFGIEISNYCKLTCYYGYLDPGFNFSSPFQLEVSQVSGSKLRFTLDPVYKDPDSYQSLILSSSTVPEDISGDMVAPGYNQGPLYKVKINSTIRDSWFMVSPNSDCFFPIEGDDYSSTFIVNLNLFNQAYQTVLFQKQQSTFVAFRTAYIYQTIQYYFEPLDYGTLETISYENFLPILNINFKSTTKYPSTPFSLEVGSDSISTRFPFGFTFGQNSVYNYSVTSLVLPNYTQSLKMSIIYVPLSEYLESHFAPLFPGGTSAPPKIKSIELQSIVSDLYLYRVSVEIPNSLLFIKNSVDGSIYGYESIVSGNPQNCILEIVTHSRDLLFVLYDRYGLEGDLKEYMAPSLTSPINRFEKPFAKNFNLYEISSVSFLYDELNVTDHRRFNILYFNYSSVVPRDSVFIISPTYGGVQGYSYTPEIPFIFYSVYNQSLQLFQIEFYVEANSPSGDYQFQLFFGLSDIHSSALNRQLKIYSSKWDLRGPEVISISKTIPTISLNSNGSLVLIFTIQDTANGFDHGYVTIKGDLDSSTYNFTFGLDNVLDGGDKYLGQYQFSINIKYPCISQDYFISETALYDSVGRVSFFGIYAPGIVSSPILNPFANLLGSSFNKYHITCPSDVNIASSDTTPPILLMLSVTSATPIDVGNSSRVVSFRIKAIDFESGIKLDQTPTVYLSTVNNRIIECKSNVVLVEYYKSPYIYGNSAIFECSVQLPLGFAYPQQIILSVYGFINNNGYFSGFSTNDLLKLGYTYSIDTSFTSREPSIESYFRITEKGGDLWLFGTNLISNSTAYLLFSDGSTSTISVSTNYSTAALLKGVKATDKPYQVHILANSLRSNTIVIKPTIFDLSYKSSSSSSTSSSSTLSSSTSIELPTNEPKSCPGKPVCSGPSNGICIANQGCVCFSGRVGLDCSSQIIIFDQPKANDTSPSTNITLPISDGSATIVTYNSLISLVSIRELDISGKAVYSRSFENWQVTTLQSGNTTLIYNTSLDINKDNHISTTSFKVTLNWFTRETNITFANEQLRMDASTMKYTIEISNYPFSSGLNQLQLVMSASIQSDSNDNGICSHREFGETTSGDNSNYIKIQVDNHSLYGRFIRRGIVDSSIQSITNVLLDKDLNSITTTKQLQSFIGIEIPNFKKNVIIDPDFSILVDSYTASSKSNSICSKSRLSSSKIAGIVIGCVVVVAAISIGIIYHIIKKKNQKKFISNMNQKMKQIN